MNKATLFIMSGTIFLTSAYTMAQTRPQNNPVPVLPQVTIPAPEVTTVPTPPIIEMPTVSTPSPSSGQGADEMNGGSQYKNKHNKGKHKAKNKEKHKNKKYKGEHKGKHKGEEKGRGKGKHKGKYKDYDGNEESNSGD